MARKIIEHCLIYFLLDICPRIVIQDSLGDSFDLNKYYAENIKDSLIQDHFAIEEKSFILYHLKIPKGATAHELHFCANNREVRSVALGNSNVHLKRKIDDENGSGFYYCGYLVGSYLDSQVNSSRTGFHYADDDQLEVDNDLPEKKLIETATGFIQTYLQEYLEKIAERKQKRVNEFVHKKQPQYRFLVNQRPQIIDDIEPELSDNALELALHTQVLKWDCEAKARGQKIKEELEKKDISSSDIMRRYEAYCKEVTALSKVSLSEYVIRRKVILDLLEEALESDNEGKYSKESKVHSIICPMRYNIRRS